MTTVPASDQAFSPKFAHSVRGIAITLGVSPGLVLSEIKLGKLRAKRVGHRRLVVIHSDFLDYLERATA